MDNENLKEKLKSYRKYLLIIPVIIIVVIVIKIFDVSEPNFALYGSPIVTIYKGETYIELGYNLSNNEANYTAKIISNVNSNVIGTYIVKYQLYNQKGKFIKEINRTVKVIDDPLKSVTLSLNGETIEYVLQNNQYHEKGAKAFNNKLDISSTIEISDNINTNVAGTYEVTYKVKVDGREKQIRRVVKVFNVTFNKEVDYSKKVITINILSDDFDYVTLPDGTIKAQTSFDYHFNGSGNYIFTIHTKNNYEKKFQVEIGNYDDTKPTASCQASIIGSATNVIITASDDSRIDRYVFNNQTYRTNVFSINQKLTNVTVRVYDTSNNYIDISCSTKKTFDNNMNNITLSKTLTPCNYNWSSYNNELSNLMSEIGYKTRDAVAAAAVYLASFPYKVAYSWGGKTKTIGINSNWGCEREVTQEICTKQTGDMKCIYGLDCTGYTAWAFAQAGFSPDILRTSSQEAGMWGNFNAATHKYSFKGNQDKVHLIKPGDIVHTEGHVGIVIGTNETQLKVANMREGIRISYINKSNGKSTNSDKSFENFVLFDDFFKMYGN